MTQNLMQHCLVPHHEIVSAEEKERILKKLGLLEENAPQIMREDPLVNEIGAKPGDLIRIYRKSPTAGEAVYYRIVG